MKPTSTLSHAHAAQLPPAPPKVLLSDVYLRLLSPSSNGKALFQEVQAATNAYEPQQPGTRAALDQLFSRLIGKEVKLSGPQLQAFKRVAERSNLSALSPWNTSPHRGELPEMVSSSDLQDIYLALLKKDGGMVKRFKAVQAAVACYEPGVDGSQEPLEQEFSRLIGRPVKLSELQMLCFKELMVDEVIFTFIAPWEDLTASW